MNNNKIITIIKTSILTLLITTTSSIFAQGLTFEKHLEELESKRKMQRDGKVVNEEEPTELTGLEKEKGSYEVTPEFSFFYVQFGKPMIKYGEEKTFGSSLSFGHKRSADNFLYGLEYNYTTINSDAKINDISLQMGFHTIWRHRFQPFMTFNFGTAFLKDKATKVDASGYKTTLDVGINLNPYSMIKFYSGMRYNVYTFDKVETVTSQEIYLMIGIDFF